MNSIDTLRIVSNNNIESIQQADTSIWFYIAIIEAVAIMFLIIFYWTRIYIKSDKKIQSINIDDDIDMGNILNSAFNAKPLYDLLMKKYHPDRFAPNEEKMKIASEVSKEIGRNRNNYKELKNIECKYKELL